MGKVGLEPTNLAASPYESEVFDQFHHFPKWIDYFTRLTTIPSPTLVGNVYVTCVSMLELDDLLRQETLSASTQFRHDKVWSIGANLFGHNNPFHLTQDVQLPMRWIEEIDLGIDTLVGLDHAQFFRRK